VAGIAVIGFGGFAAGLVSGKRTPLLAAYALLLLGGAGCHLVQLTIAWKNMASISRLLSKLLSWIGDRWSRTLLWFLVGRGIHWVAQKIWFKTLAASEDNARFIPGWVIAAAYIGVLLPGVALSSFVASRFWPYDRVEDVSEDLIQSELENNGLLQVYEEQLAASGKDPRTFVTEHVVAGLKLLNDRDLATRSKLLAKLVDSMDDKGCAGHFTGKEVASEMNKALNGLSSSDLREWCAVSGRAIVLSLRTPAAMPDPSEDQTVEAFRTLYSGMEKTDVDRLGKDFSDLNHGLPVSDAEACWAAKTYFGAIAGTSPQARAVLLRLH
jgi:hypothetical protein